MTEASPDLNQPLQRDAMGSPHPRWGGYDLYPTFSWPWWLRRGWLFWPIALVYGMGFATWHASGVNVWSDWPGLAWRACAGVLVMVTAGPLLATAMRYLSRHLNWPILAERILVIAAILAGLAVAVMADTWVDTYHHMLMMRHAGGHMAIPWLYQSISNLLQVSLDGSTMVLIFACGGFAVFRYLGERKRLAAHAARRELETVRAEKDAADMRLAVLQAQVEPHFLFNTLASVRSLITTDPERAAATINAMADYLRSTLPSFRESSSGLEEATLGRQIDICRRYLDLMNVRMNDRIDIVIDAPEEVRALPFPPLLLISLVENAVKHGLEPKPGQGMIAIRARRDDHGALVLSVEDDGAGLSPGISHGVGLANVRAQLRNRFGDTAALDIASRSEGGTRAAITLERPAP